MSKDIDNNQVAESIGVWRSLKNNNSWIQSSPEKKNSEQDNVREDEAVDIRPASSYVLSTAEKFEARDQPILHNNVMEKSAGSVGTSDNEATGVNAELLPKTLGDSTVQDAKTMPPFLCDAALYVVAYEADLVPSDQATVELSSNATAVTEASSSVPSFEHTASTQLETSTAKTEDDKTLTPEKIAENPVEFAAIASDMPLPDNLTATHPPPADASGPDTESLGPGVMETPVVSKGPVEVSAINDDASHGDLPAAEAAPDVVTDLEQFTTMKVNPPFVYMTKQDLCFFCHKIFGNVKLMFSDPPFKCHPECLKCAVCSKDLGDLLTTIFSHEHRIICDNCFLATL